MNTVTIILFVNIVMTALIVSLFLYHIVVFANGPQVVINNDREISIQNNIMLHKILGILQTH